MDKRRRGSVRAGSALLMAIVSSIVLVAGHPQVALAECDGPYPSFRNAARVADRIVFGTVTRTLGGEVHPDGRTSQFVIDGWSVLEEFAVVGPVIDVQSQPCAGYIVARPGDQIAIAFNGRDFASQTLVNAVAWMLGAPPDLIGIEVVTVQGIYEIVGREVPTELSRGRGDTSGSGVIVGLGIIALGITGLIGLAWVFGDRTRRAAGRDPGSR